MPIERVTNPLPSHAMVGMVHVGALPGTPRSELSPAEIVDRALRDAETIAGAGFDALIIENMHDAPYVHGVQGPEVVAGMGAVAAALRREFASLVIGVQVLSGGNREALAIAHACGLNFIRCENFVFSHVADEGLLERAEAGPLLRYRRAIAAGGVAVFCDIKKKHASHALTADLSLEQAARGAAFFGADGLIVTGTETGEPTDPAHAGAARAAAGLPVLIGSGAAPDQLGSLLSASDGVIVGSWLKRGGVWHNEPDPARCAELVTEARRVRAAL